MLENDSYNQSQILEQQPKTVFQAVLEKSFETLDGACDTPHFISESGARRESVKRCKFSSDNNLEAQYVSGHYSLNLINQ